MPTANNIYYFLSKRESSAYPPLVLIHGAGGNHLSWPAELRRLPGRDIHALDLPGHGKSSGHGEQSLPDYADRVVEWMDAVSMPRAVFAGHSMGGGIALDLAIRSPHRTAGIALISSGARLPIQPELIEYASNPSTFPSAIEILRERAFSGTVNPRLAELTMRRLGEIRPSVLHNDYLACADFDVTDKLEEITRPALVICGTEDRLSPLRRSQFLASKIPKAELRVIPEAGHMVILEKPGEVAEMLREFLKKLRTGIG